MNHDLWVSAFASSSIPSGEEVERLLCNSLEENTLSVQGFWLWQQRTIQQRQRRERARRRGRSGEPSWRSSDDTAPEHMEPRNEAEAEVAQHAENIHQYIASLVRSTGYPYSQPTCDTGEATSSTSAIDTHRAPLVPTMAEGITDESLGGSHDSDRDVVKEGVPFVSATSTLRMAAPAQPPKSALARLVAKAKAAHAQSTAGCSTIPSVRPFLSTPSAPQRMTGSTRLLDKVVKTATMVKPEEGSDDDDFSVVLPHEQRSTSVGGSDAKAGPTGGSSEVSIEAKHPSRMTREEFLSQFKRAPRRGEVGQTAEEIKAAENLGYVMSGSRSLGAQMYVDRIQRQLHEREAAKLQQQFRKVEDERMDLQMVAGMVEVIQEAQRLKEGQRP